MRVTMFSAVTGILFFLLAGPLPSGYAQEGDAPRSILEQGLEHFRNGRYEDAMESFEELLSLSDEAEAQAEADTEEAEAESGADGEAAAYRPDAFFWIGRSALAAGRLGAAEENIEHFLENYPDHRFAAEAQYHKGRLLYLQADYQQAIQSLEAFISQHPDSRFLPNAYYWVGESLYSLGHLDRAAELFRTVTEEYPASYRAEAADYRLSVIELNRREESLRKLLRWSHREYLNALDEFEQRERTYEEALAEYRERLRRLAGSDFREEMDRLSDRVEELEGTVERRDREIRDLQERLSSAPSSRPAESEGQMPGTQRALIEAKEEALDIKEYYVQQLRRLEEEEK